jgi:hypothetical protein
VEIGEKDRYIPLTRQAFVEARRRAAHSGGTAG